MPENTFTQEIGIGCNMADSHARCPARYPDRLRGDTRNSALMPDDVIVENALTAAALGFQGHYGWQFYSEPLLHMDRIERVQTGIRSSLPHAKFILWTNGVLIGNGVDPRRLGIFQKIVISNYSTESRAAVLSRLVPLPVRVIGGRLDRRMQPGPPSRDGCTRVGKELVLDAYGDWRLCCGDWEAHGGRMNVRTDGFLAIATEYGRVRALAEQHPQPDGLPSVCLTCRVRRHGQ